MSWKAGVMLVAGLALGGAGGYYTAKGAANAEVAEARSYQAEFAQKSNTLTMENMGLKRRMGTMESSTYDRQAIRGCMTVSNVLSTGIGDYLSDRPMGNAARGMFTQHMSSTAVAVQGKSRQAAMSILLEEHARIDGECLDRARIKADPTAIAPAS
ncbi:hypothetical protein [Xanthomonas arboricola]|uniref:hypothetical protein n=1 Tax=Xanthomonas arboricola TaxID=56448 RepID=UPI0009BB0DF2|nr:hypothetical protein [Xanthomonas arboricola]